ncbi:ParB/RepB/Spo0J family partition protein [Xiamenia xianingshaonis]|nr:ParB/RepB/Spo0J family partition protein [Xiamenia xianingshaonis]
MAKAKGKGGLGRGLNSLLGGSFDEGAPMEGRSAGSSETVVIDPLAAEEGIVVPRDPGHPAQAREKELFTGRVGEVYARETDEVPLASIVPNPDQPRTNFKVEELRELADSIRKEGLLQPILVREMGDGTYQIIAGERRWKASQMAGLSMVPVRLKAADDETALELAMIENIQRSDLNPIEEAYGYRRMMERRGMTQAEVAQTVSKGRSTIANALRLLELPQEAQQLLFEEKITAGHARAILSIPTPEGRQKLTDKLKVEKLSVREAEAIARLLSGKKADTPPRPETPPSFKKVARALKDSLHTNVKVRTSGGKNRIEIEFADEEDLERLFALLGQE